MRADLQMARVAKLVSRARSTEVEPTTARTPSTQRCQPSSLVPRWSSRRLPAREEITVDTPEIQMTRPSLKTPDLHRIQNQLRIYRNTKSSFSNTQSKLQLRRRETIIPLRTRSKSSSSSRKATTTPTTMLQIRSSTNLSMSRTVSMFNLNHRRLKASASHKRQRITTRDCLLSITLRRTSSSNFQKWMKTTGAVLSLILIAKSTWSRLIQTSRAESRQRQLRIRAATQRRVKLWEAPWWARKTEIKATPRRQTRCTLRRYRPIMTVPRTQAQQKGRVPSKTALQTLPGKVTTLMT